MPVTIDTAPYLPRQCREHDHCCNSIWGNDSGKAKGVSASFSSGCGRSSFGRSTAPVDCCRRVAGLREKV